jgi:hypothetical protein
MFYVIDPDDLECSTVSQLTYSSARHLRNDPVLITEKSDTSNSRFRGGALSSPEFWNSHARKMLPFGQDRLYKDKLSTRSILIDGSIHDYLGGACVRVHIRASGNYSHGSVRFEASHYSEELIIA